jgi:hypothetical protein
MTKEKTVRPCIVIKRALLCLVWRGPALLVKAITYTRNPKKAAGYHREGDHLQFSGGILKQDETCGAQYEDAQRSEPNGFWAASPMTSGALSMSFLRIRPICTPVNPPPAHCLSDSSH